MPRIKDYQETRNLNDTDYFIVEETDGHTYKVTKKKFVDKMMGDSNGTNQ